jgi:putative DNA primase/helicase
MEIAEIKRSVDIVDVVGKYVALRPKGKEFTGLCPFHNDSKPSFAVVPAKQIYSCHVCSKHGDVIDFVQSIENLASPLDAAKHIAGNLPTNFTPVPVEPPKPKWAWLPSASDAPEPPTTHHRLGEPSMRFRFTATFYVYRFETDKGKEIRPLTYCTDGSKQQWRWQGIDTKRPLYNSDALREKPDAPVIVVEGEKTADALQGVLNGIVVTTWHGGTGGVSKTDFTPLRGRKVFAWPDNDAVGWAAMAAVQHLIGQPVQCIAAPDNAPKKWDFADCDWDNATAAGWIKANKQALPEPTDTPRWASGDYAVRIEHRGEVAYMIARGEDECTVTVEPTLAPAQPETVYTAETGRPFKTLGYSKTIDGVAYWFYSVESRLVHCFTASSLSKNNLLSLAPAEHWEALFPGRSGFDATSAADNLMREAYDAGIFDAENIRGRGAWIDDGRVVVHSGDKLIVDGTQMRVTDIASDKIYEINRPLNLMRGPAINTQQGKAFIEMLSNITWERNVNAQLLAGWCVVAPVCGALQWRPHVWITGGAGTGKTWIMREVVGSIIGKAALMLQGESTEAGIRQSLGHDARPVIFDEAEAEDKASADRIEKILNLMRASSAESEAVMLKGSASHEAKSFTIRSCFLFASIIYQARKQADLTRVTVLGLKRNRDNPVEQFDRLREMYREVMTDGFLEGFHTRTLERMPTLLENIEVFTKVAAKMFGGRRLADQIAPLCAGAWLLVSDKPATAELAERWMAMQNWDEESALEEERDEYQCLKYIMEQMVSVETGDYNSKVDRTVGELIAMCCSGGGDPSNVERARQRLARMGVKVEGVHYTISNSSEQIKHVLRGTQWEKNHGKVLQRIDNAEAVGVMYFAPGHNARGVRMKWEGGV